MTDGISLNPDGKIVLNANGQRVILSSSGALCCFPVNYAPTTCCWGETISITFDDITDNYGGGDVIIEAAVDWIAANFSSQTIDATYYGDIYTASSVNGWIYNGNVFYVGGGFAYYVQVYIAAGDVINGCFSSYTIRIGYNSVAAGSYSVGDPVPLPSSFPSPPSNSFILGTTGTPLDGYARAGIPNSSSTEADCCEGAWGDGAIYLWSTTYFTASTGINGIATFTTNSQDEECSRTCNDSDDCYQITGYTNGDLIPCATGYNSSDTVWDGSFTRPTCSEMDEAICAWYATGGVPTQRTISGKRLDYLNTVLIRQCGWVLQICGTTTATVGGPTCIIWVGYKATGTSPDGVYTRLCGVDTTASLEIEACP